MKKPPPYQRNFRRTIEEAAAPLIESQSLFRDLAGVYWYDLGKPRDLVRSA